MSPKAFFLARGLRFKFEVIWVIVLRIKESKEKLQNRGEEEEEKMEKKRKSSFAILIS